MSKPIAMAVLLCASPAFAGFPTVEQQMRLAESITADEARAILGAPDKVESRMCGSNTAAPWQCRGWTYEDNSGAFIVLFYLSKKGVWRVESWHVIP